MKNIVTVVSFLFDTVHVTAHLNIEGFVVCRTNIFLLVYVMLHWRARRKYHNPVTYVSRGSFAPVDAALAMIDLNIWRADHQESFGSVGDNITDDVTISRYRKNSKYKLKRAGFHKTRWSLEWMSKQLTRITNMTEMSVGLCPYSKFKLLMIGHLLGFIIFAKKWPFLVLTRSKTVSFCLRFKDWNTRTFSKRETYYSDNVLRKCVGGESF